MAAGSAIRPGVADESDHRHEYVEKKEPALTSVHQPLLDTLHPDEVDVLIQRAEEAERDEMWSYVAKKTAPRWWWHAIDHQTGKVWAYVCGRRQDQMFLQRKALLKPFGITRSHTDSWGAYTRHLDPDEPKPGKRHTQQIERKHVT